MILEIDAGNTRAKWRLRCSSVQEKPSVSQEFIAVNIMGDAVRSADLLCESLVGFRWGRVEKIWVSNVRGCDFEEALASRLLAASGLHAEFPKPVKCCAGVTNGYDEPARLGVDRWLAILAAYNVAKQQCCVVDCGTTITLDLVSASGLHLGGYILPGIALMKSSLSMRSGILQSDARSGMSASPGRNTASAINNGVLAMIAGLIKQVLADESMNGHPTTLFLTGGDGELVKGSLATPCIYQSFLVLDGLQFACSELASFSH